MSYLVIKQAITQVLPPYDECSIRFMLQIIAGKKFALNLSDIRPLHVPRLGELKLQSLLEEVKEEQQIKNHLPDLLTPKARHNRKFVVSVISTIKPNFIMALLEHAHKQRALESP